MEPMDDDPSKQNPSSNQGWITIVKKAAAQKAASSSSSLKQTSSKSSKKWFVVYAGHQPGIYSTWPDCQQQLQDFSGSCFKAYDTHEEAQTAFYNVGKASNGFYKFHKKFVEPEHFNDFFDPGLPIHFYEAVNNIWKAHKLDQPKVFRQHLSSLAANIAEQCELTTELKKLCIQICLTIDWEKDFTLEQINCFFRLAQLVGETDFPHNTFTKINRICSLEKVKHHLLPELSRDILSRIENHTVTIRQFYVTDHIDINLHEKLYDGKMIPKLTYFLVPGFPWSMEPVDWGVVNKVIFTSHDSATWKDFPAFIKSMIMKVSTHWRICQSLTFWITSSIGWRENTKFFQPYQIWHLKRTDPLDYEHTTLQNSREIAEDINAYTIAIHSLLNLQEQAKKALQGTFADPPLKKLTDGRRVFITNLLLNYPAYCPDHVTDANAILTKMAHLTGDFPSYIRDEAEAQNLDWDIENLQSIPSPASTAPMDDVEIANLNNMFDD